MSFINDVVDKILNTPEIANGIRKSLVNRDLAIEIDGRKYQITTRKPTDNDLDKLKIEIWDLRQAIISIVDAYENDPISEHLLVAVNKAKDLLNKRR